MTRTLTIGGLDTRTLALREAAGIPLLGDEVPVQAYVADCLAQAMVERQGVILIAPAGAGKTVARDRILAQVEAAEHGRQLREAAYVPRRVVAASTIRAESARDLYIALYKAAFKTPPVERLYRRRATDDEIREQLIARCEEEHVVTFVIDEAQTLTDAAVDALRDLMAVSESMQQSRIERTPNGDVVRPGGVGVLLLGTTQFQVRLPTLSEYGRRWDRVETVGPIDAQQVPDILRQLLPSFNVAAGELGDDWHRLVDRAVTRGNSVTIGQLIGLTRTYLRRAAAEYPKARKLGDLPWDAQLFEQAVYERVGLQILGQEAA